MALENKLFKTYISNYDPNLNTTSPELFADIHIDNPFGQRIKASSDCDLCKGTGYVVCPSGKHERACKLCLSKIRIQTSVEVIERVDNEIKFVSKVVNPKIGCKKCMGTGIISKNSNSIEDRIVCSCSEENYNDEDKKIL